MLCLPKAKKGARCFLDASDLPPDEDDPEERTAENYGVDGRHFHEERPASFNLNIVFLLFGSFWLFFGSWIVLPLLSYS